MKTNHSQLIGNLATTFPMFGNKLKHFVPIALAAASLLSATVTASVANAASECRPAWSETSTPTGSNSFYAVAALTENDVWAVGSRYDGTNDRPLAEHFNGGQWVTVTVPAPGTGAAYLRGVGGSSGTDVWAAGY